MTETAPLEMNPAIRGRWTAALRSGDYPQGREWLRRPCADGPDKYCCLGVLCELAARDGIIPPAEADADGTDSWYAYAGCADYLPDEVITWAGLGSRFSPAVSVPGGPDEQPLAFLNDDHVPFARIADLIDGTAT